MPIGKPVNLGHVGNPSIGSKATPTAMKKALNVASGSEQQQVSRPASEGPARIAKSRAQLNRGSSAGLKNAPSTHLIANDTGYLNATNQHDRMKSRTKLIDISPNRNNNSHMTPYRMMSDSRLTSSKDSSISILKKKIG